MGFETLDHIVSVGAEGEHECVIAETTVDGEADRSSRERGRVDGVVAGAANDHEIIAALGVVDRNLSGQSADRDEATGSSDVDGVVLAAAVDRHGVGRKLDFMEAFPDEGDMDMPKALALYRDVGYRYMLMPDHVPRIDGRDPSGVAFAYCYGYIQALLDALGPRADGAKV